MAEPRPSACEVKSEFPLQERAPLRQGGCGVENGWRSDALVADLPNWRAADHLRNLVGGDGAKPMTALVFDGRQPAKTVNQRQIHVAATVAWTLLITATPVGLPLHDLRVCEQVSPTLLQCVAFLQQLRVRTRLHQHIPCLAYL